MLFPVVNTQRLTLRQAVAKDLDWIYQGLSDPKVIAHYGIAYGSKEEAKTQLEWYDYVWQNEQGVYWVITRKSDNAPLGTVGYFNWMQPNRKAEISFWLVSTAWRQGYMREALEPSLTYGFKTMNLHRAEALVEAGNTAGAACLKHLGFVHEGTMRSCELKESDDAYISLELYGLLENEYQTKAH